MRYSPINRATARRFVSSTAWMWCSMPGVSLDTVETYCPLLVSCPPDITKLIGRAETAVAGKYVQLGEVAVGSAVELSGTIITPFGAYRGHLQPNAFENAVFLWETGRWPSAPSYRAHPRLYLTGCVGLSVRTSAVGG